MFLTDEALNDAFPVVSPQRLAAPAQMIVSSVKHCVNHLPPNTQLSRTLQSLCHIFILMFG